jgi:hypothetical protein
VKPISNFTIMVFGQVVDSSGIGQGSLRHIGFRPEYSVNDFNIRPTVLVQYISTIIASCI